MTDPDRLPTTRPATADRPAAGPTWLTLDEAAQVLGTSREAVRSRARRGSLRSMKGNMKGNDGVLRVLVDRQADRLADHGRLPGRPPVDQPDREVDRLADPVAALRAEVARLQAERDGAHVR